jgi:hypothetical protein
LIESDVTADETILTFAMKVETEIKEKIIGRDCPKIKRVVSSLDRADGHEGCNNYPERLETNKIKMARNV